MNGWWYHRRPGGGASLRVYRCLLCGLVLAVSLSACTSSEVTRLREENVKLRAELGRLRGEIVDVGLEAPTPSPDRVGRPQPGPVGDTVVHVQRTVALKTSIDSESGATVLATEFEQFDSEGGLPIKEWIRLEYSVPRQATTEATAENVIPEESLVRMVVQTRSSPGSYAAQSTVSLVADGRRFDCPVLSYDVRKRRTSRVKSATRRRSDERVVAEVSRDALRAVAEARDVRLGRRRLKLSEDQRTLFAAIDRQLRPSSR